MYPSTSVGTRVSAVTHALNVTPQICQEASETPLKPTKAVACLKCQSWACHKTPARGTMVRALPGSCPQVSQKLCGQEHATGCGKAEFNPELPSLGLGLDSSFPVCVCVCVLSKAYVPLQTQHFWYQPKKTLNHLPWLSHLLYFWQPIQDPFYSMHTSPTPRGHYLYSNRI